VVAASLLQIRAHRGLDGEFQLQGEPQFIPASPVLVGLSDGMLTCVLLLADWRLLAYNTWGTTAETYPTLVG
jgi:hypothetical protein